MLRISKLTDYAIIIMAYIGKNADKTLRTNEIASSTNITTPTVAKLLKKLTKANFLSSVRGAMGGYKLAKSTEEISIADIINCVEGQIGLTECSVKEHLCDISSLCNLKQPWMNINAVIFNTLDKYTLNELINVSMLNKQQKKPLKSKSE